MNQPKEIALNYIGVAKGKTEQAWYKLLILASLAGAFIALGGALATIAGAFYSGTQSALIRGAVFPLGLILVVICGAELFTGNCLLVAPLLNKDIKPKGLFKNWGLAYLGNFIGAVLIAVLVVYSQSYSGIASAVVELTAKKCDMNFGYALLKGILCNMLVCLAVWAAMASKSAGGKILAVYLPVFAFVVCGFEHSIANMFYLTSGFMTAEQYGIEIGYNFGEGLLNGLLAPTIGNIIGGCLVAVAYLTVYFGQNKPKADNE